MVTREQLINGLIAYIDREVIPPLSTSGKWIVGSYVTIMAKNANNVIDQFISTPMISALNVISPEGLIDENVILSAITEAATKYGKLTVNVPMVGNLSFDHNDISKLRAFIGGRVDGY